MRYLTDKQAEQYPSLSKLDSDQAEEMLRDADWIYGFVDRREFASDERLRQRAAAEGITLERLGQALGFLRETKRLVFVPENATVDDLAVPIPRDLREWDKPELEQLAGLLNIEGRSSMRKGELIDAIIAAAGREPQPVDDGPPPVPEPVAPER